MTVELWLDDCALFSLLKILQLTNSKMKFKNSTLSQDANKVDFSVCKRCFGDAIKNDRIYDEPLPN